MPDDAVGKEVRPMFRFTVAEAIAVAITLIGGGAGFYARVQVLDNRFQDFKAASEVRIGGLEADRNKMRDALGRISGDMGRALDALKLPPRNE